MSRIGKAPIQLPKGVKAKLDGMVLTVEGKKGKLTRKLHDAVVVEIKPEEIIVRKKDPEAQTNAFFGLTRALIANMVKGVDDGFKKVLEIVGVGYKAQLKGKILELAIGYSHLVEYLEPEGIKFSLESPTRIVVEGIDREKVGQTAAEIRKIRKPEPYKGKGIKYENEFIKRKVGKTAI